MKAVRFHQPGGPEVLQYEEVNDPQPGPGQALVEIQAVGVNMADVGGRKGAHLSALPMIAGQEAAGLVTAVGDGVTEVAIGDLVAYRGAPGAYAERQAVASRLLVKLPEGSDARTGAAAMHQGICAHFLCHTTYPLKAGNSCLIHAGAGGVGLLLIQMAKRLGAFVIATVSTNEKAQLATEAGADKAIIYTQEDFQEEVMKATDGKGVEVVYDSVDKDTFLKSLASLTHFGCLVLYGHASGYIGEISPEIFQPGSKYLARPGIADFVATREDLLWRTGDVFNWVLSGELKLRIGHEFPLSEAAEAHRQLEARATTGKLLLIP